MQQRSALTFKLSPQMLKHIEWCENRNNMPEVVDSDKKIVTELICQASKKLPKIPVEIFGVIYDLDAVSTRTDRGMCILKLHEEISSNIPIADPQNDICPVYDSIRDNISALRKEWTRSTVSQPNRAALFQGKPEPEQKQADILPVEDEYAIMQRAIKAIKEDRLNDAEGLRRKHHLNVDVVAEAAAEYGQKKYAELMCVQGAKVQSVANGAAAGNHIKHVEELMLNNNRLDFTEILVSAYRKDVFNDDKSCMRFLSGIESPRLRAAIVATFKQIAPMLSFFNIGITSPDFHNRLAAVYQNMPDYMPASRGNFDTAYENMMLQFERRKPAP